MLIFMTIYGVVAASIITTSLLEFHSNRKAFPWLQNICVGLFWPVSLPILLASVLISAKSSQPKVRTIPPLGR